MTTPRRHRQQPCTERLGLELAALVLMACVAASPTAAQEPPVMTAVVAGVDDPNNAPVGAEISMRCVLLGPDGTELRATPEGRDVAELGLSLELTDGPENGLDGDIDGASVRGVLNRSGLYVFGCTAANAGTETFRQRPTVVVARLPAIEATRVLALPNDSEVPRRLFEAGRPMRIVAAAFSDSGRRHLMRTERPDILPVRGEQNCAGSLNREQALEDFALGAPTAWDDRLGHVDGWIPRAVGIFTFLVNQFGAPGVGRCDAITVRVVEDAFAPEISIDIPSEPQFVWSRPSLPVRGKIDEPPDGISEVTVTNGLWSDTARLFDIEDGHRTSFNSALPYAPGLNLITVIATDTSGHTSRAVRAVVVGSTFERPARSSDEGVSGYRELHLQTGRSLLLDASPPIDSLSEAVDKLAPVFELLGRRFELAAESVEEYEIVDVVDGVFSFLVGVDVSGEVRPGRVTFGLRPRSERLDLAVIAPLSGRLELDPTLGGDGSVTIGGAVEAVLPFAPTAIGGLGLVLDPDEIRVVDRLRLEIDSAAAPEVDRRVRAKILDRVETHMKAALAELLNCVGEDDDDPLQCEIDQINDPPVPPFAAQVSLGRIIRFVIELGDPWRRFSFDLTNPFDPQGTLQADATVDFASVGMGLSRVRAEISPGLWFEPREDAVRPELGELLNHGDAPGENVRRIGEPDLRAAFGTGARDVQGAVHLNAVNQVAAALTHAGVFDFDLGFVDTLANAGFFASDEDEALTRVALKLARLRVRLLAPPRLGWHYQPAGLYAEIGPIRAEIDLSERYDSRIVLEGGLISKAKLVAARGGQALQLKLADPTVCAPDEDTFSECGGRFELSVVNREGLTPFTPSPLPGEALTNRVLARLGARAPPDGAFRSNEEFDLFWRELVGGALSRLLANGLPPVSLPVVPLPEIAVDGLSVRPLEASKLRFHDRLDGGPVAEGWIGFEFDLGAAEP